MSGSKEAKRELSEEYSDPGVGVSHPTPDGIWKITCPTCESQHVTASRLCPVCTAQAVHKLRFELRKMVDQNDKLRDAFSACRGMLFEEWHKQAVADGDGHPEVVVEKRWSKFLRTIDY